MSTNETTQKLQSTTDDETMLNETTTNDHNETSVESIPTMRNETRKEVGSTLATDNLEDTTSRTINTQTDTNTAKQMVRNNTESQGKYKIKVSVLLIFQYLLRIMYFVFRNFSK